MAGKLDAALAMARRGYKVFPIRPYGKKPAVGRFQLVATTDEAQIRAWWTAPAPPQLDPSNTEYGVHLSPLVDGERECNIGVLTTDLVVADIDTKKGEHALANYYALGGHFDTLVVRTATGGFHGYFDGPDSKLAVDIVPGVDIRSHNGYVVGPGSYVDPSLSHDPDVKQAGWYELVCDHPRAYVPIQLELSLEPPGRRERSDTGVELDTASAIENARVWLESAEPAVQGAGGDNHTYDVCAKMVRDFALTTETAFQLLWKGWNERCMPPWTPEELYRKVENAADYGQGALGSALPEAFFAGVTVLAPPSQQTPQQRGIRLGNLSDASTIPPRPWMVTRLGLRGEVTLVAAPGAGGKSMIILTAVCHWAVGKDFGAYKLTVPGVPLKALVYNAEDDMHEQSRRVLAICNQFNLDYEQVRANLCIIDESVGELCLVQSNNRSLSCNEQQVQFVMQAVKEAGASVVVMEPLVNLHACNENDPGEMRFVITTLKRIARECAACVMVAHHTAKGAGGKGDESGIRGSGAIVNSSRIAQMLSGASDADRLEYGIRDHEAHSFVRIDDAKANLYLKSGKPVMWLKWQGQRILNGDMVGVPNPVDMSDKVGAQKDHICKILHLYMVTHSMGSIIRQDAVRVLQTDDNLYAAMNVMTLRRLVEQVLKDPVHVGVDKLVMDRGEDGKEVRIRIE